MERDTVLVVDFGGQYAHLIAGCVRKLGVYAQTLNPESPLDTYFQPHVKGIILSGGPASVYEPGRPHFEAREFFHTIAKPVLGICYGHQLMADAFGGEDCATVRYREDGGEYGPTRLSLLHARGVLEGLEEKETVLMSHRDCVDICPPGFMITAETDYTPCAAMEHEELPFYGVQFHPEVTDTPCGMQVLDNFLRMCGAERSWTLQNMQEQLTRDVQAHIAEKSVLLLYSGGVDSSVTLALLQRMMPPDRLHVAIIDTGLLRTGEAEEIREHLRRWMYQCIDRKLFPWTQENGRHLMDEWLAKNVRIIRVEKMFLEALQKVYDPEEKRRRTSDCFALAAHKALCHAARGRGGIANWLLAQGTIYPDTIESARTPHAERIKTHHNVGAANSAIGKLRRQGRVVEPIAALYKDDVRALAIELGVPIRTITRHPFPGPGLAVRILCSKHAVWPPQNGLASKAIAAEETLVELARSHGLKAATLPLQSVGVHGDQRSYAFAVALEGMAEWDELIALSREITNRFPDVINRVLWRLSPPRVALQDLVLAKTHITQERVRLLQEADDTVMRFLRLGNWNDQMWQFPVVLAPLGYCRGGESIILRPVNSVNAMTATVHRIPPALCERITHALLQLRGVHEVFYDLTGKPPGTIEWE